VLSAPKYLLVMLGVLLSALLLRILDPTPVAKLRYLVFDTYQRLSPQPENKSAKVRVVDIDEASLAQVGQWPWPRTRLAKLVDQLHAAGAKVIAADLLLAEPDRLSPAAVAKTLELPEPQAGELQDLVRGLPTNDKRLADAMAKAPVVLGVSGVGKGTVSVPESKARFAAAGDAPLQFVPTFPQATPSLPELVASARGLGAVNWLPAHDQVVRSVPTLISLAGKLYPSLTLEALRVGQDQSTVLIKSSGGSGIEAFGQKTGIDTVKVGKTVLQTTAAGQVWLRFGPHNPDRFIPAHTILTGQFEASEIEDAYVLIGASATGLMDLRATPLEAAVPGVEIHAQALEQMLAGTYLQRPAYATGLELGFMALIAALVMTLIHRWGPLMAAVAGVLALATIFVVSWQAYAGAGVLVDPVYPSLAVLMVYLSGSLFSYVRSEAERARVRSAFSHYVAPQLVEQMADHPEKLKLGGETREVTLLFSDVRGFSRLSENMEAEDLIRFVNALFTPLSEIILEEQGTIDKFMGDAVMAFWNAPVPMQDHATLACQAALRMQSKLRNLNTSWKADAAKLGHDYQPVQIGIGLNTGDCCVGNVGSPERFDYSLLGDPVNIASRLESETKTYQVPIIAGERTVSLAKGFAFLPIGNIQLRGKDKPETVSALLGDSDLAASQRFQSLLARQTAFLAALHDPKGTKAKSKALLKACEQEGWPELSGLFKAYHARLSA
jgi:adenylate cyclase